MMGNIYPKILWFKCLLAFFCLVLAVPMSAFGERIELKAQEIISKITASKVPSYDGVSRTISIPIDDSTLKNFEFSETDPLFTEDYQGEEKNWETYEIRSESHKGTLIVAGNELYISFSSKDYSVLIYPGSEGYYELVAHSTEDKPNFSCGNKNDSEEVTFETEVISELKGGIDAISTELTLPNRRLFRLALNIDKTWIDKFHGNIQQAKAFAAQEVLGANVMFFRPFLNAALVISRDIYAYPNQSLSMEESADLLEKNPGYSSFDIGHLFRGELLDKIAGGRALNGGACGASGKQRDKAVAYSVCRSQGIDCQQTFAHEVGHQLSLNHTWSECPIKQDVRSDAFAKEAADGSSIMSYYGFFRYQCGFRAPTERPVSLHTKYSASSIFNFRKFLERNPNCGIGSPNKAPYLPFKINFDSRIPFRTPFSILVTVLKDVKNIHKVWAESDIVLPKSFTHLGRFDPLIIFMDPEMRSAGTTLRIDFPTFIGSPKSLPCENGSRKWGAAGCFSEQEVPYDHPFRIGLAEGGGGVSSLKFNLHVSGSRFGFNDDYLSNVIWTGGKEETVYWHVGGGSIAKRVNIYFVLNYGNGPEEDIQETFPKTFGSSYRLLASSVSNNGSTKIKVPKANLDGFLLIVPEATTNAPFIFWSRSQDFKIRCGSGSSRPGGSICEGDDCECEEPTATPTPGAETPTATPSANPTFTPTVTPSVTPNLTATPRPTATPGNQCDTVPPCFGRWEEFDSQVQCTVGGNPNYFDFPVNYPPSWGPACNHEVLNSLPYCYGAPCERCKSLRPGKIVWFKLIDQNGNGHPESECCDGYGCSNPPSSAGMLVRGICVECVIGGAE